MIDAAQLVKQLVQHQETIVEQQHRIIDLEHAVKVLAKDLYNCINGLPRQDSYIAVVGDEVADIALAEAGSELEDK